MDVTVITSQLTADYFIVTDDQPQWLAMLSGIFKEYQTHCKTNKTYISEHAQEEFETPVSLRKHMKI